jgi:hypothetical protein
MSCNQQTAEQPEEQKRMKKREPRPNDERYLNERY